MTRRCSPHSNAAIWAAPRSTSGARPTRCRLAALARHPRVVATPHIGGLTLPAVEHQALETVSQVAALMRGEMPAGAVTLRSYSGAGHRGAHIPRLEDRPHVHI